MRKLWFGVAQGAMILGMVGMSTARAEEAAKAAVTPDAVESVTVTASTLNLLGKAATASQGSITKQELELRPVYRVGQLLETIPGLTVTAHSGEGKANQYLLRGFNLDHGTDLATSIDGMPVNMRTHTHGQGYTDLNFFIPELAAGIDFTKGPYSAAQGDFASVGADHIALVDTLDPQVSLAAGSVGDRRVFAGASRAFGQGRLLAAGEYATLDGPWEHGDDFRKTNLALRYSTGDRQDGVSLTGLYYRGLWNATTDQPRRAVDLGLIGRLGTLDPSDGGQAERFSLSGEAVRTRGAWRLKGSAYGVRQQLTLWNNFTHMLEDPVAGDQHGQNDRRTFVGGALEATVSGVLAGRESRTSFGAQARYDDVYVDLRKTRGRQDLETLRADRVKEGSLGLYVENTTYWSSRLRTIVGLREDAFHVDDDSLIGGLDGKTHASLLQPKGSIVLGPWAGAEVYVSAGRGFHSNDGRAGAVAEDNGVTTYMRPPLLVASNGYELGLRGSVAKLQLALALFQIDFDSELVYNADAGQTEAGRPSRRRGVEVSAQYRPFPWLELNSNIALSRARYRDEDPEGRYIEDAPKFVGALGARIDNLGPWFGALQWRDLGAHALVSDNTIRSPGYSEINMTLGRRLSPRVKAQVEIFNLTNSRDNAADYFYADRILPTDPVEGVESIHSHPLEPRSWRVTVMARF